MDLMEKIRKLKPQWQSGTAPRTVENPLPRHDMVFNEIQEESRRVMIKKGVSWAELLDGAGKIAPELTDMVLRLCDEIDTDVYGRYVDGTLTQEELEEYYQKLDRWKRLSLEMLQVFEDNYRL